MSKQAYGNISMKHSIPGYSTSLLKNGQLCLKRPGIIIPSCFIEVLGDYPGLTITGFRDHTVGPPPRGAPSPPRGIRIRKFEVE